MIVDPRSAASVDQYRISADILEAAYGAVDASYEVSFGLVK
jgi:hypothetical protein